METTYVRLGYIDERATIFVLRVAFAFLAAASVFSLLATLVYVRAENTAATYVAALSTIINLVAAWHYNEVVKVRVGQGVSTDAEWAIDALRHSDWAVTMPLLILKLYALINNPNHDLILNTVDASALCSTVMILLGAYTRLGLDELADFEGMSRFDLVVGMVAYAGSVTLLVLLLIDLVNAYSGVEENTTIFFAFFLVWPVYALVAFTAAFFRQGSSADRYPKFIALGKDLAFSALDIFSKAVFAWHTCSAAFGKQVLGS
jgi:hypothetical protein